MHLGPGASEDDGPVGGGPLTRVAAAGGARAVVAHGGHLPAAEDPATGVGKRRKTFTRQAADGGFPLPVLVENTAGGGNAMARDLDAVGRVRPRPARPARGR